MILLKNFTLVTQNEARQIIKEGALLINETKIADIGPDKELIKKYKNCQIIDGKGMVALPGLINVHTHAAMSLLRGYADDMPLKQWLEEKIWPKEAKLTEKDIYEGTLLAGQEMLKSGTMTFSDMYFEPQAEIKAVKKAGLRGIIGLTAIEFKKLGPSSIEQKYQALNKYVSENIKLSITPHSIYAVGKEALVWCANFARENKLLLHIHLSETEQEIENCLKLNGCRPIEYLDKIGFLGPNVIAAHVCWATDEEIKILAKNKVSVAHCPSSNLKLVSGIMPLSKLLKAGVNVALGTDGPSSNNSLDMFWEMKLAALIHKWNEQNPQSADAQTILDMATVNSAKALGLENELGSLEIGKEADIIMMDFDQPHLTPHLNTVSHLVYAVRGADVRTAIIGGKIIF